MHGSMSMPYTSVLNNNHAVINMFLVNSVHKHFGFPPSWSWLSIEMRVASSSCQENFVIEICLILKYLRENLIWF